MSLGGSRKGQEKVAELLSRLANKRDDEQAWELLYGTFWPYVLATMYRLLHGQRELAQDASQEIFYRLLRYARFDNLRDPQRFFAYVATMCRNVAHDVLSETVASVQIEESVGDTATISPEERVRMIRLRDEILEGLDEKGRELAALLIDGYTLREIADRLGISYGNVGVRIHRLRLALRRQLSRHDLSSEPG